jgi:hypothetical protein
VGAEWDVGQDEIAPGTLTGVIRCVLTRAGAEQVSRSSTISLKSLSRCAEQSRLGGKHASRVAFDDFNPAAETRYRFNEPPRSRQARTSHDLARGS